MFPQETSLLYQQAQLAALQHQARLHQQRLPAAGPRPPFPPTQLHPEQQQPLLGRAPLPTPAAAPAGAADVPSQCLQQQQQAQQALPSLKAASPVHTAATAPAATPSALPAAPAGADAKVPAPAGAEVVSLGLYGVSRECVGCRVEGVVDGVFGEGVQGGYTAIVELNGIKYRAVLTSPFLASRPPGI